MTAFLPMFDPPFLICDVCCAVLNGMRGFKDFVKTINLQVTS